MAMSLPSPSPSHNSGLIAAQTLLPRPEKIEKIEQLAAQILVQQLHSFLKKSLNLSPENQPSWFEKIRKKETRPLMAKVAFPQPMTAAADAVAFLNHIECPPELRSIYQSLSWLSGPRPHDLQKYAYEFAENIYEPHAKTEQNDDLLRPITNELYMFANRTHFRSAAEKQKSLQEANQFFELLSLKIESAEPGSLISLCLGADSVDSYPNFLDKEEYAAIAQINLNSYPGEYYSGRLPSTPWSLSAACSQKNHSFNYLDVDDLPYDRLEMLFARAKEKGLLFFINDARGSLVWSEKLILNFVQAGYTTPENGVFFSRQVDGCQLITDLALFSSQKSRLEAERAAVIELRSPSGQSLPHLLVRNDTPLPLRQAWPLLDQTIQNRERMIRNLSQFSLKGG